MSSSKRMTHLSAFLAVVGIAAISAAFAIGLTGWPPARANAADMIYAELPAQEETVTPAFSLETSAHASGTTTSTPSETSTMTVTTFGAFAPPVAVPGVGGKGKTLRAAPKPKKIVKRHAKKKRRAAGVKAGPWHSARVSWYGPGFYGNTMAGGGTLTRSSMVVAHRSLPFGTKIQFSYRGRSAIAVVRDRGPYVSGRQFDLGPGVARKLKFGGVDRVKYRIIKR